MEIDAAEKMIDKKTYQLERRYFVLVGSLENWQTSLHHNLWGFTDRSKGLWNKTNSGDYVAFYVTSPISRVIGFGRIGKKFISEDLVWNDEKRFKRSLWKYRLEIIPSHICKNTKDAIELPLMMLGTSRKVVNKDTFMELLKKSDLSWHTNLLKEFFNVSN